MEKDDLVLGRVCLNTYKVCDKKKITPVIEILDDNGAFEGQIVCLKVIAAEK